VSQDTIISATIGEVASELESALDAINLTRIMVIDDNRKDARLVKRMLEVTRLYSVHEAYSAKEALDALGQVSPQLVVLDLMLPDVENGTTLIDTIRAKPAFSATPIVVLSAKDLTSQEKQYLSERKVPVWQKTGLDRHALVEFVKQTIQQKEG
jgi:CheY-like chemotaxis protein